MVTEALRAGDPVFVRRDRQGRQAAERWELREVLAVDGWGDASHTCPSGNPAAEEPTIWNTLESQNITGVRTIPATHHGLARKLAGRLAGRTVNERNLYRLYERFFDVSVPSLGISMLADLDHLDRMDLDGYLAE